MTAPDPPTCRPDAMLAGRVPDEETRRPILVDNPATLYDFPVTVLPTP